jgi:hypothetical protein
MTPSGTTMTMNGPTTLTGALVRDYLQIYGVQISHPALYNNFSCGGNHVTSTAYFKQSTNTSRLLALYTSIDGTPSVTNPQRTFLTPAGVFHVLTVLVGYAQTVTPGGVALWQAAQTGINQDHAGFAAARGYGAPIVTFANTNVFLDASLVADPRSLAGLTSALQQQGTDLSGVDLLVSVNIDPTLSEGGFATPGSVPGFIYMGNYDAWKAALAASDYVNISRAVYDHEVAHHWGWPGTHDWATCGDTSAGFHFVVPPVLLGWEDLNGNGIPEILDANPYSSFAGGR